MRLIKIVGLIFILSHILNQPAQAIELASSAGSSAQLIDFRFENQSKPQIDNRSKIIYNYLSQVNSPLAPYSHNFVLEADNNQIDWKLLVAISGIESSFGKRIPYQSYNAWGWGNGKSKFNDWETAISHISKVLNEKYYQKGLNTPEKIAPVYAPPSQHWSFSVNHFMDDIENSQINNLSVFSL